jgi:hypothetical protein
MKRNKASNQNEKKLGRKKSGTRNAFDSVNTTNLKAE